MSIDLYIDPPNTAEIMNEIKNAETHDQVVNIITNVFPGWILGCPKKYSKDYQHFQHNWEFVCKQSNCNTLCIIIVDKIIFNDPNYSLIRLFCELLTVFGHSVRRKEEFIECNECGCVIPTQIVYNQLVERKINVPPVWSVKCKNC
jgi:hypothetical protein